MRSAVSGYAVRMSALFNSSPDRVAHPCVRTVLAHLAFVAPTALLLGLAFPEPGWGFLAHVALVPMTLLAAWAWRARRLFWTSFVISWAWWLIMISWMSTVTGLGYAVLAAYLALYWPVFLLCWRRVHRTFGLPAALTLPLVWVSLEYVRGFFVAGGFPWFSLGYSQLPYTPTGDPPMLAQSAALFGEWTVSFLVAMTNGMAVDVLSYFIARRRGSASRQVVRTAQVSLMTWIATFALSFAYAFFTNATKHTEPPVYYHGPVVAVIQTSVDQSNKNRPTPQSMKANWDRLASLTRQAAKHDPKPDVIVWPETMVPAPLNHDALQVIQSSVDAWTAMTPENLAQHEQADQYRQLATQLEMPFEELPAYMLLYHQTQASFAKNVAALAKEVGTRLIVGAAAKDLQITGQTKRYNAAYLYLPDGSQSLRYDKIHRVPFGEYIPWVEDWPWLKEMFLKYLSPYESDYTLTPGSLRTVFSLPYRNQSDKELAFRVTTPICFEDAVARFCRHMVYGQDGDEENGGKRCDALINITNDGWYPGTDQGPQHFQMAVMRCIENRVPMARAVNTGVSGFIAGDGRVGPIVNRDGETQRIEGFEVHRLERDDRTSIFAFVGTVPISLVTIATGILVLIGIALRKKVR